MAAFRRPLQAAAGLLAAVVWLLSASAPSMAAPPFPAGARATALVGGTPLVQAVCPQGGAAGAVAGGNSTRGGVSVFGAGARCTQMSAAADGLYAIAGATPPGPGSLRFTADCDSVNGHTGNAVDVPAGTNVTGIGVVPQKTTVTTLNTVVTYPNGTTAIVNEVVTTPTSVTRNAIRITSGPNAGTIIGQVLCGGPYPLAVDAPSAGGASPAIASPADASAESGWSKAALLAGVGVGAALIAQLFVMRSIRRRRSDGAS